MTLPEFNVNALVDCLFGIDDSFMSHLNGRFSYADYVSDITTGIEYRKLLAPDGALRSKYNISLTINTDGVAIVKSSSQVSLWPVYLTVNELPP